MAQLTIYLPDQETIKSFCATIAPMNGDFLLIQGRSMLDARSLMGIFSLDLDLPMTLKFDGDSPEMINIFDNFKEV